MHASPLTFSTPKKIRFSHCDPAGIVFYPRYFGLLHEAQEDWLAHIGHPEHEMIGSGFGVPIVNMQTDFCGMSRFGETVDIELSLWKLGGSSIGMQYEIYGRPEPAALRDSGLSAPPALAAPTAPRELRLRARSVVVYATVPQGKATRLPDALRAAMLPYLRTTESDAASADGALAPTPARAPPVGEVAA